MSEKRYSLLDVTEILKISVDTLYSWERDLPELKPQEISANGDRSYSEWEVLLLQQVYKVQSYYNHDLNAARHSIETWISKNPRHAQVSDQPQSAEPQNLKPQSAEPQNLKSQSVQSQNPKSQNLKSQNLKSQSVQSQSVQSQITRSRSDQAQAQSQVFQSQHRRPPSEVYANYDQGQHSHTLEDAPQMSISPSPILASYKVEQRRSMPSQSVPERAVHSSLRQEELQEIDERAVRVQRQTGGRQRSIGKVDLLGDLENSFDLSPTYPSESVNAEYPNVRGRAEMRRDQAPKTLNDQPIVESHDAEQNTVETAQIERSQAKHAPVQRHTDPRHTDPRHTNKHSVTHTQSSSDSQASLPRRQEKPQQSYPRVRSGMSTSLQAKEAHQVDRYVGERRGRSEALDSLVERAGPIQQYVQSQADWLDPSQVMGAHSGYLSPLTVSSSTTSSGGEAQPDTQTHVQSAATHPKDEDENVDWQHAYRHNQAQLARVRGELVRSQETIAKQHREIKQLQVQLLSIREQVLKEMYDLRDLVLDK